MELRQLEAFVAVAEELHFGRAAERLLLSPATLSELIRRLERELGTPLFTRTTRRVVITSAGAELLTRSKIILEDVAAAGAAVRRIAGGDAGTVRLGITPPAAPTLVPHLLGLFAVQAPHVSVEVRRMWLPGLTAALLAGDIDVAITCGLIPEPPGIATEVFCAETLLVGLRPSHRLASHEAVALADLAHDVIGLTPDTLFPAWALSQRQALSAAGAAPPAVDLADTDLAAVRWAEQEDIGWILLISSLASGHAGTVIRPVRPRQFVPFVLQWNPGRASTTAVARFVRTVLAADLPDGWHTQPGHLRHQAAGLRARWSRGAGVTAGPPGDDGGMIGDRWGVTESETLRSYPCDDFVVSPALQAWRGVRVEAPAAVLWPWVTQMRLAPYSYDWIDNRGRRSPRKLAGLPEPHVGDRFTAVGGRELGRVVSVDPPQQLTGALMGAFMSYVLVPQEPGVTRLLLKIVMETNRWAARGLSVGDLIMARRQLLTFKHLAERYRPPSPAHP